MMNPERITGKQAVYLMSLFIVGGAIMTGNASQAGHDSWICLLLGGILCLPLTLMYARISSLFPGKSFFDALLEVFGKIFGRIISLIMSLYFFMLGIFAISGFTGFIRSVSLERTPRIFMAACLAALCGYTVSKGLNVMGRCVAVIFFGAVAMMVFSALMLMPAMKPENLLPMMGKPVLDIFSGSAAWFCFPLAESVVLLSLGGFAGRRQGKYRIYISALCASVVLLLIPQLISILTLGGESLKETRYPYLFSVRAISASGFARSEEALVFVAVLVCVYARVCVSIYAATRGFSSIFAVSNYKKLALPATLLAIALSLLPFSNAVSQEAWTHFIARLALPIQTVLPAAIWIAAEIRAKKTTRQAAVHAKNS